MYACHSGKRSQCTKLSIRRIPQSDEQPFERTDILQALLEEGADVNIKIGNHHYTPLRLAVDQGYFLMAKMIVLGKRDLAANKNWIEEYMQRENNGRRKRRVLQLAGRFHGRSLSTG